MELPQIPRHDSVNVNNALFFVPVLYSYPQKSNL